MNADRSSPPPGAPRREKGRKARQAAAVALALLLAPCAQAQGFAGLGTSAEGFTLPDHGPLTFPADHGLHPGYRVEWWYLTANLTDAQGTPWGLQWTLFRTALDPATPDLQIWMGHAALTGPDGHLTDQRLARSGTGQAGVTLPFEAWIDDWRMSGDPEGTMTLTASGPAFAYDLTLTATGPLVLHGDDGYSVKSPDGQASRYYSQPFLSAKGTVETPEGPTEVTGTAWLDREWSSQPLSDDQSGWDWFSLTFDSGEKLMAFRVRGTQPFTAATWIAPDGTAQPLPDGALTATPGKTTKVEGHDLPLTWTLDIPSKSATLQVTAIYPDAWMPMLFPYWEGPVTVTGTHPGTGYLEMTGHD